MKITVLCLFPEIIQHYCSVSIPKRIIEENGVELVLINIRSFAEGTHFRCDEKPFGGGAGMLMQVEPIARALESLEEISKPLLVPSPDGRRFLQSDAEYYAKRNSILLLAGHYEGIDARIKDLYSCDVVSLGDYVLSSGELACLNIIDSILRLQENGINKESLVEESFTEGLLEHDQYTRPSVVRNLAVPDVLLSGHHKNIEKWKEKNRELKTKLFRPDIAR